MILQHPVWPDPSWWVCDTDEEFTKRAHARQEQLEREAPKYLDHLGAQLGDAKPRARYMTRSHNES